MSDRFAHRYAPMQQRAVLFDGSANWMVVLISLAILWFGSRILFTAIISLWMQSPRVVVHPEIADAFFMGSTPAGAGWSLATFFVYVGITLSLSSAFHGITLRGLIGPLRVAWAQFWRVSLYLSPIYALITIPLLFDPTPFQQYPVSTWLVMLPAFLPLLFVQIGAEELVFRGYLQGHIAALGKHPIMWMGVPSILFGLAHFDSYAPAYSAWAYVVWATLFGLICADVTARSGTLGPALAVHFVNNIAAVLILSSDDWLFGAALYVWPMYGAYWEPWIPFELLALLTVWIAARLAMRR